MPRLSFLTRAGKAIRRYREDVEMSTETKAEESNVEGFKLEEIKAEALQMDEYEAQPRKLKHRGELIVGSIAIALSLFQLVTSWTGPLMDFSQRAIHIAFVFTILFAIYPPIKKSLNRDKILWIDWLLIVLSLACTIWVVINGDRYIENPSEPTTIDLILGTIMIVIVLEATRRVLGLALPIIAIVLMMYAFIGPLLPGVWAHRGFGFEIFIANLYTNNVGMWGFITGISATIISGFLIFGTVLEKTGGGDTFVKLSLWIAGRSHGGPAKVSCFSSAFFGTISGSAVANVVVDGVFNIPLMKGLGYKKEFAAAVESVASTGGQIVPPVMGAGAFIMAEILGIPYAHVAFAAIIPAFLYYLGCYTSIHFEAQRLHLKPVPREMIPSFRKDVLPKSLSFVLPAGVLVYLVSTGYSPSLSALYSILVSLGYYLITVRNIETLKARLKLILFSLEAGGKAIVMVASLCLCAQMIVSLFNTTGLGVKVCQAIIDISQGQMFITLFLGMIVCTILGMGIPSTAAYVLAVSVVGPVIVGLGGAPLSAHMFVFYYAILASITPPVCAAVYVASAIAGSDWWKTGWVAVRLGLSGFVIPFMFFYSPTLLLYGDPLYIVINSLTASIGVVALSAGVMGFFLKPASWIERILLIASAFLLIDPGLLTDALGILILGSIYIYQRSKVKEKRG
jgi:TRAP transporter 4TM/12TM fusion protein